MSRHIVSNLYPFHQFASSLFIDHETSDHRQLICLENTSEIRLLASDTVSSADICIVSADTQADRTDRITHLLGQEHLIILHELARPIDAGLLAALTGTLQAGGVLILILPEYWQGDAITLPATGSRFSQRFYNMIERFERKYPGSVHLLSGCDSRANVLKLARELSAALQHRSRASGKEQYLDLALKEQDQLLKRACVFLQTAEKACITITGRRGRGKTTLLARIAAWLTSRGVDYAVTAAHSSALDSFYQHVDEPQKTILNSDSISQTVASVLLVDEAASLPLGRLKQLLASHEHVVFCTTVEGYESAGRAFDVRFTQHIKVMRTRWLELTPTQSWRWGTNDPLESFVNELLINDAPSQRLASTEQLDDPVDVQQTEHHITFKEVTQQHLSDDESLLRGVFHLLRESHYQTTVQDLQHLLDGEAVRLWVLQGTATDDILGVLLVSGEGNIATTLHTDIVNKRRRLPHQLLPQLLAQTANCGNALGSSYARVVRISIKAELRRRGFGSFLLKSVESQLLSHSTTNTHTIGASFATDAASIAFWEANGYREFHRGFRLNPRTGLHSVAVIKTTDDTVGQVVGEAIRIHQDNHYWRSQTTATVSSDLSESTQNVKCHDEPAQNSNTASISNRVVAELMATESLSDHAKVDKTLLRQFAYGHRSTHDTYAALARLAQRDLILFPMKSNRSQRAIDAELRNQVASLLEADSV